MNFIELPHRPYEDGTTRAGAPSPRFEWCRARSRSVVGRQRLRTLPTTPPATAPPIVAHPSPPDNNAPPRPPQPAPIAVFVVSRALIPLHPARPSASPRNDTPATPRKKRKA